jgi:general secretion pathway protein H
MINWKRELGNCSACSACWSVPSPLAGEGQDRGGECNTKKRYFSNSGFTLTELLVVMFIIAIVTTVAALSINGTHERQLENSARLLQSRLQVIAQEAVLTGVPMVLSFTNNNTYTLQQFNELKQTWQPVTRSALALPHVNANMQLQLPTAANKTGNPLNSIYFSTGGTVSPFTLTLLDSTTPRWRLTGDYAGRIDLSRVTP